MTSQAPDHVTGAPRPSARDAGPDDPPAPARSVRSAIGRLVRGSRAYRAWVTRRSLRRHAGRSDRKLEIGPGGGRMEGFETLDILGGREVDYPVDAARALPFPDGTFALVYASHVLEHIPWYHTEDVLREWVRILRPGGALEVWVPDALRVAEVLVRYENEGIDGTDADGWYRFNPDRDPARWAAGRTFTYGDGTGRTDHPNWHRALFTPRYLMKLCQQAGLTDVARMDRARVRGYDHGWINLGVEGRKP